MEEFKNIQWPGWETIRLIGRGSYGAVYEIERDLFGKKEKAALKHIGIPQNPSDIEEMYSDGYDDESITASFQSHLESIVAEYSLMRKLNGAANVVNCDDVKYVQREDGIGWDIFIKMELLTPLTKALQDPISEETVIKIAEDMCHALSLCKRFDIVHRDIKPQNIFVSPLGDYKLGDFGIAKTVEKTMGGTKTGTYKYMAPEVYNNQPYGQQADIYSLGLVLYWLLNKRRMPFMPLPPQKLTAGMDEQARNRRLAGESLPPPADGSVELKRIVLKACTYDPKDRYHTADEMLQALKALELSSTALGAVSMEEVVEVEEGDAEPVDEELTFGSVGIRRPNKEEDTIGAFGTDAASEIRQDYAQNAQPFAHQYVGNSLVQPEHKPSSDYNAAPVVPLQKNEREKKKRKSRVTFSIAAGILVVISAILLLTLGKDTSSGNQGMSQFVAAGSTFAVGIKQDGTCAVSGRDSPDVSAWTDIVALTANGETVAGLKRNGTVVLAENPKWYFYADKSIDVQSWNEIIRIDYCETSYEAEGRHLIGLRSNGSVVASGTNSFGECNVSSWDNIIDVAAGGTHSVGLRKDGTVVACGNNVNGQCDVADWNNIVDIAAARFSTYGLTSDGKILVAGSYMKESFGYDLVKDVPQWDNVIAIIASNELGQASDYVIALCADGSVVSNRSGYLAPGEIESFHDVKSVAASSWGYTICLDSKGNVFEVGWDVDGERSVDSWPILKH